VLAPLKKQARHPPRRLLQRFVYRRPTHAAPADAQLAWNGGRTSKLRTILTGSATIRQTLRIRRRRPQQWRYPLGPRCSCRGAGSLYGCRNSLDTIWPGAFGGHQSFETQHTTDKLLDFFMGVGVTPGRFRSEIGATPHDFVNGYLLQPILPGGRLNVFVVLYAPSTKQRN
jgi:hypothetical protein